MHAELRGQAAFYLTGRRAGDEPEAVKGLELRPALLARYRDLSALRYDYPLVLLQDAAPDGSTCLPLSELVDRALGQAGAEGTDGERLRVHALRLEREVRRLLAAGAEGTLAALLEQAGQRLGAGAAAPSAERLRRWHAALPARSELLDCTGAAPVRQIAHAWRAVQRRKAERFAKDIERLVVKLADILRADDAGSAAARAPASLRASVGTLHADAFNFEAMSRVLSRVPGRRGLSDKRRRRVESTLEVLGSERFFAAMRAGAEAYEFRFGDCAGALAAYRERLPGIVLLARAMAIAELEIGGEFSGPRHDALFERLAASEIAPRDLALFPDYLVCLNAERLDARELANLQEILAGGLPMKVLVQTDDVLGEPQAATGHPPFGARTRQLAGMALALDEVFVLQAAASQLPRLRARIERAMAYPGAALLSVFSGACAHTADLPPYLVAAAAAEARVFPAFACDPGAGADWAARFSLEGNPQPERDWPQQSLAYEDAEHQRVWLQIEFTPADYAACDRRYAKHFARVPRMQGRENTVPAAELIAAQPARLPAKLPELLMVDRDDFLHRVIVDERLVSEARRCRAAWRSLQELGGINNSHAARALAQERAAWEAKAAALAAAPAVAARPAPAAAAAPAAPEAAPEAAEKPASDEPYIETPRCSSCDECIQINPRMFAYDANKQARIVDPDAGTYRQLVEAAESCQVAIIHPGKPKNPDEPGLEELLKRAEAFQ